MRSMVIVVTSTETALHLTIQNNTEATVNRAI